MDTTDIISKLQKEISHLNNELAEQHQLCNYYKEAYEKLMEKEAYNFALFQFNPFHTVIVDRNGRVIKSNTAKQKSGDRLPNIGDIMYKDYASKHSIDMYSHLMDCIRNDKVKTFPEMPYEDRYLAITISPFPEGAIVVTRDITAEKHDEQERIKLIKHLQKALEEIETLRDLLPICASCKRIRDDSGYWQEVEEYFKQRSHLDFSHTMCPDCVQHIYPEVWEQIEKKRIHRTASLQHTHKKSDPM